MTHASFKKGHFFALVAVLLVTGGAFFFFPPDVLDEPEKIALESGAWLDIRGLPDTASVEGEAFTASGIQPLSLETNSNGDILVTAAGDTRDIVLRVKDGARLYDVSIGQTVTLSGFTPRAKINVAAGGDTLYRDMPLDWAGRTSFETPVGRPARMTLSSGAYTFTIGLLRSTGGLS